MISSLFSDDNEGLVEDVTESVGELAELGIQTMGLGTNLPLEFEGDDGKRSMVIDFPLSLDGETVNLDFSERNMSVSLPEGSEDDADFNKQEIKNKVQELVDFPSDVDNSSLSARIEDGSLIVEGDTETNSTEESEDF